MKSNYFLAGLVLAVLMASCAAPKQVAYFQDVSGRDTLITSSVRQSLTVHTGDKLMIVVHSSVPELAAMFNLPVVGYRLGTINSNTNYASTQSTMSYIVASDGTVDFPVLGKIKVEGMTREAVAEHIRNRLVSENHCSDAVVNVELDNVFVNVIGDVSHPGRIALTQDRVTVLDILSQANDLAITGLRQNVMLMRETGEGTQVYTLDLTNLEQLCQSPAYNVQQGDIIYVEPNKMRKRQTTVSGNNLLNSSFWVSVASVVASLISVISVASR